MTKPLKVRPRPSNATARGNRRLPRRPLPLVSLQLNSRLENMGMTVIDTTRLNATAPDTAMAMSRKSCPASS